ncbi:hypothetical protein So717_01720 [Roseobacter cerasinus]|uniref:DUF2272 domain-containing protein n=1 Tax=Roseobacter cerasinus TaxID=2602289 RepID=A0A640VK17_9RHOB|nr:DUF2272 domain-containing protein [Roseobacter cerasinus]GFE48419.1 hypothetical protein So717_01720 [Roseobacter cerasinus]
MSDNPYRAEITQLTTAIIDLQMELATASGAARDQLQQELNAKITVADKLQGMSEAWRLGRLAQAVSALQALAASELAKQARVAARLNRMMEAQGVAQAATSASDPDGSASPPPASTPTGPTPAVAAAPPAGVIRIEITPQDLDALARVAQSEVGHFGQYGAAQLTGGVQAVVETILNRVAHGRFPGSLQAVMDQPSQFSAINATGSWAGLSAATSQIQTIVTDYLNARVAGQSGVLGGATHFLNPFLSSSTALSQWGNHVVANAVAVFGNEAAEDVHFHGFAPGTSLPQAHAIHFGGWSPVFDGAGRAASSVTSSGLRVRLLSTLKGELTHFENGKHKENADSHFSRVGDYWRALGLPYHGQSVVTFADGSTGNPAWSAAFISWAIAEQGVGADRFKGAQAHWKYVQDLVEERLATPLFDLMDPEQYAPRPGDIVHYGRATAARFHLAAALDHLKIDGYYPSHSDFVIEVDQTDGSLTTVGGNVDNSVKSKRVGIDSDGLLKPRRQRGEDFPWIAVLRLRDG